MNNQLDHLNVLKIINNDKHGNGIYITEDRIIVVYGNGYNTDYILDYGTTKNNIPQWCADLNYQGKYKKAIDQAVLLLRNIKETNQTLSGGSADNYKQYTVISAPLWWHEKGLLQTATGYGSKLTTTNKVFYNNRLYRVYCHCFSNCGSLYILVNGERKYLN